MNILHLSDFHLDSHNSKLKALIKNINDALEKKGNDFYPDILLLTGDYTEQGTAEQYEWFWDEFQVFSEQEAFSHIRHIMVLPGNHDFPWSVSDARENNFIEFCGKMDRGLSDDVTDRSIRESLAEHMIKHVFIREAEYSFLLVGMNSMKIDSLDWPGIGYFEEEQLRTVHRLIAYYKKVTNSLHTMVAFHHLVPVSALERDTLDNPKKFSLTLDARRAIDYFLDNDVGIAVHGHQHQPSVITWIDEVRSGHNALHIISAGCLAGRAYAGEGARNSFMLYTVNADGFTATKAESAGFDSDKFCWDGVCDFSETKYVCTAERNTISETDGKKRNSDEQIRSFKQQMGMVGISNTVRKNIESILQDALTGERDKRREAHILMLQAVKIHRKAMVKCLKIFMDNNDEYMRGEAYYCFGILTRNKKGTEEMIAKGLEDTSYFVRACCANILTRCSSLKGDTLHKLQQADDLYKSSETDKNRNSLHYYAQIAISIKK